MIKELSNEGVSSNDIIGEVEDEQESTTWRSAGYAQDLDSSQEEESLYPDSQPMAESLGDNLNSGANRTGVLGAVRRLRGKSILSSTGYPQTISGVVWYGPKVKGTTRYNSWWRSVEPYEDKWGVEIEKEVVAGKLPPFLFHETDASTALAMTSGKDLITDPDTDGLYLAGDTDMASIPRGLVRIDKRGIVIKGNNVYYPEDGYSLAVHGVIKARYISLYAIVKSKAPK